MVVVVIYFRSPRLKNKNKNKNKKNIKKSKDTGIKKTYMIVRRVY
jgi:hypothetical protein